MGITMGITMGTISQSYHHPDNDFTDYMAVTEYHESFASKKPMSY